MGPIKRSEYDKALAEFNAKYANSGDELAKIKKEIKAIEDKAIADGRKGTSYDSLSGMYYDSAKLTPEEQREVNSL